MRLTINLENKTVKYSFPFELRTHSFNEDLEALNNASKKIDALALSNKQVERGERLTATRPATDEELNMAKNHFMYKTITSNQAVITKKEHQLKEINEKSKQVQAQVLLAECLIRRDVLVGELASLKTKVANIKACNYDNIKIGMNLEDVIMNAERNQKFIDEFFHNKKGNL